MRQSFFLLIITMAGALAAQPGTERPLITTGTLFEEMADMERLTRFPDPAFRTIQYSSFDHRSTVPGGPYWFANSDGFGGEPVPNFEAVLQDPDDNGIGSYLIADVEGPGAIVRLWTASIEGTLSVYLDRLSDPLYEGPADDFFRRPYDGFAGIGGIDRERFTTTVYQRDASYAPIPFAEHLRVVWKGNIQHIHFYQLQVRLYDQPARVQTFTPADIERYRDTIHRTTVLLSEPGRPPGGDTHPFRTAVAPGAHTQALTLRGSEAVRVFTLKIEAVSPEKALRQTVLRMHADGYAIPQIEAPCGDFFGAAPGINPYESLPFSVHPDGTMICRFVMPFHDSLTVSFENYGDQPVGITGSAETTAYTWDERSLYFRARWRVTHDLTGPNRNIFDLPFLLAQGAGLYAGTTSIIMNPADAPASYGNWWGEGDEKVFVDDDTVPSFFGTGSEDYYNYSWSSPNIFYYPYCGQPRNDGPGNRGFVANFRWHLLDAIPFRERIAFYMELYHHDVTPGMSYARTGYYYARPGVIDDSEPLMAGDLRELRMPVNWQPSAEKGAADAVFYAAETVAEPGDRTELVDGAMWEGSKLFVWKPAAAGETLDVSLPVLETGRYRLVLTAALSPESGSASFMLDGQEILFANGRRDIDFHRPFRTLSRSYTLTTKELWKGSHTLTLVAGSSENRMIGLDFFWLQKR
ncbi:DUF2961 domain-containing protein [bacterium]|nr:DUF2961 domain-containing protein [bacterium]